MRKLDTASAARRNNGVSRTLRNDLRVAIPDAAAALGVAGIAFAILVLRLRAGTNPAALEMPTMIEDGGIWPYTVSQAIGWSALAWSWLTILLGVSLPYLVQQRRVLLRETIERLHRSTSLTVVGLMIAHAVPLIWDKMGDTLLTCFIPWTTPYLPGRFPQALGIFAFYLAILLGLSFYLRDKIGRQMWRALHRYFVPAVYVLAVWHTLAYGSDVKTGNAIWAAVFIMQLPIVAAFVFRLLILPRRAQVPASVKP